MAWMSMLPGHGVPLAADIAVGDMMKKDQERYPERREELLNMLGVDPNWRMHQVCEQGSHERKSVRLPFWALGGRLLVLLLEVLWLSSPSPSGVLAIFRWRFW